MNEKIRVLLADIFADEAQIAQIFKALAEYEPLQSNEEHLIIVGYYLHNLYTAFEHLSTLVASAFENQIGDRSQWHSLLLRRMKMPIEGIRPPLFTEATFRCLDELRAFRHVFRSAYSLTLDPDRVELVLNRTRELHGTYLGDLARFKEFLEKLEAEPGRL